MKHTPGPWRTEVEDETNRLLVTDVQDVIVAEVFKQPLDPNEWATNNMKLIAAAPEMLDILEGIERWQNGDDNEFHTTALELLKRLRAG